MTVRDDTAHHMFALV